jgi:hypothetical protein
MSTRIVYPLDVPISLAPGHVRSGPFRLNFPARYWVYITVPISRQWEQANPQCNPYRRLRTQWVLYRDGKAVGWLDEPTLLPWSSYFEADSGTYELDVEVLNDFRCLDPIHPRLVIIANTENYEAGAFAMKAAAILAVYFGLCSLVFVPLVRTVGEREEKHKIAESGMGGQNFQWAQRLPLRRPIHGAPSFGLLAGMIVSVAVAGAMMIEREHRRPLGLWVHTVKPGAELVRSDSWTEPLIVRLRYAGSGRESIVYVNSTLTPWDELSQRLKEELSRRRDWVVYVEGDDDVAWGNVTQVIDVARGLNAKVFLLAKKITNQ